MSKYCQTITKKRERERETEKTICAVIMSGCEFSKISGKHHTTDPESSENTKIGKYHKMCTWHITFKPKIQRKAWKQPEGDTPTSLREDGWEFYQTSIHKPHKQEEKGMRFLTRWKKILLPQNSVLSKIILHKWGEAKTSPNKQKSVLASRSALLQEFCREKGACLSLDLDLTKDKKRRSPRRDPPGRGAAEQDRVVTGGTCPASQQAQHKPCARVTEPRRNGPSTVTTGPLVGDVPRGACW